MKTFIKSIFLCILTASSVNINAQNCALSGRIYSSETKTGITHASLLILDEDGAMITGISSRFNGKYSTDSLPNGLYYLSIQANGFNGIELLPFRLLGKNSKIDLAMIRAENSEEKTKKEKTGSNPVMPAIFQAALKNFIGSN
jgi:hypothetical protein